MTARFFLLIYQRVALKAFKQQTYRKSWFIKGDLDLTCLGKPNLKLPSKHTHIYIYMYILGQTHISCNGPAFMRTMSNLTHNFTSLGPYERYLHKNAHFFPSNMGNVITKKHGDVSNKTWRLPLLDSTSQVCSRDLGGPEVGRDRGCRECGCAKVLEFPTFGCAQKFYIGWNPKNALPTTWKVILQIHVFLGVQCYFFEGLLITWDIRII